MLASILIATISGQSVDTTYNTWAFDCLQIPSSERNIQKESKNIIVAVIDDAFRLTHKTIKPFVYKNPGEVPGNQMDDDGNGFIDDVFGWDISDNDNDVSVPEGRSSIYFHGTLITSIITQVVSKYYGDQYCSIKILPVKVLSNQSQTTYLKDGYKGINYANNLGADIICLAWSGGEPGPEEINFVKKAHERGVLIIASAGNFSDEKVLNPAALKEVMAIAGIDQNFLKEKKSNFGEDIDISAPAVYVKGGHPVQDNAFIYENGTSVATALVTACAAVLKSINNDLKANQIREILLNTATPFDKSFKSYSGKMGAGIVNLGNAIQYMKDTEPKSSFYSPLRPKGFIILDDSNSKNNWDIEPAGGYFGFRFITNIFKIRKPEKHKLSFYLSDSLWIQYNLSDIPEELYVPATALKIVLTTPGFKKRDLVNIEYFGIPVDSSSLYCSGTKYLNDSEGFIEDGSRMEKYTNLCDCKWIINVEKGKRIRFEFDQMNTQTNIDFVYLFDGSTAIPENIIAKFSGQHKPPIVISRTNEVLVWFLTDKSSTGQGWRLYYEAIE